MSEIIKLIGEMAERGWVYTTFSTFDSIAFTHTDGEVKKFDSWDDVAAFVEEIE